MALGMFAACIILLAVSTVAVQSRNVEPQWMLFPDAEGGYVWQDLAIPAPDPHINELEDIEFRLYTPDNPNTFQKIVVGQDSSLGKFNASRMTILVIHGYNGNAGNMKHIRLAYMLDMSVNCIMVDWSAIAGGFYTAAKRHVVPLGNYIGKLLNFLANHGLRGDNVHLVGHSLGAHAAGVAAYTNSNLIVGRITGLDPALPLYGNDETAVRLDKSDAKFVQVIHTCGGILGWADALGHADFFPNDGTKNQPGCGIDVGGACSHSRSHHLFAQSVKKTVRGFIGVKCTNWVDYVAGRCSNNQVSKMGEVADTSLHGKFYLSTASEYPY